MSEIELSKQILEIVPAFMSVIRAEMRAAAKAELTLPQFRVLVKLSKMPSLNGDLADWIGVSAPTMSGMIDVLVARGLVKREGDREDRRQIRLSLTSAGEIKYKQIRSFVQQRIAERLEKLSEAKRRAVSPGLAALKELLT